MERVADVLGRKYPQFNTVSPNHCLSDALYQMAAENVEYLIVLEDESFMGIISRDEVANKALLEEKPIKQVKVKECINKSIPVATLSDSVEYALELLDRHNTKYLAVYDRFDFKGIVTNYDLMQQALSKRNRNRPVFHDRPLL